MKHPRKSNIKSPLRLRPRDNNIKQTYSLSFSYIDNFEGPPHGFRSSGQTTKMETFDGPDAFRRRRRYYPIYFPKTLIVAPATETKTRNSNERASYSHDRGNRVSGF